MLIVRLIFSSIFILSLVLLNTREAQASSLDLKRSSEDPRWLRLYQYKKHWGSLRSDVNSDRFFFSLEGRSSPQKELETAIEVFSAGAQSSKKYGTLQLPAACAFPARKTVLEQILDVKFPVLDCPDLKDWQDRLHADRASLVFVGAYSGNAASIVGHTFLRLSNQERESSHREGIDLLSYVVGYTAHTPATDGRLQYITKGLTGGYPGFYDIEPYYMKVGLYNNSESRDLWELKLNMSPEEVDLLVKLVWEYTFNAQISYFFIGENCSYRLLTLLEAAQPELDVSRSFYGPVLPAETVRIMIDKGFADPDPKYRASILRRLQEKISQLSEQSKRDFRPATKSIEKVNSLEDPNLLDALMDYWLYENYKVQTRLPQKDKELMEATIARGAALQKTSTLQISNVEIKKKQNLSPPFLGHRPHWVEVEGGLWDQDKGYGGFHYRSGIHPIWLNDRSYQDVSAIEYLGFDLQTRGDENPLWSILMVKALTLEDVWREMNSSFKPSWGFDVALGNDCLLCSDDGTTQTTRLNFSGAFGVSQKFSSWQIALLPEVYASAGTDSFLLAPGVKSLVKWGRDSWSLYLEKSFYFMPGRAVGDLEARFGYGFSKDLYLMLKVQTDSVGLSSAVFF